MNDAITGFAKMEFKKLPKAFVINDDNIEEIEDELTLKVMQKAVEGYIEKVNFINDKNYNVYVNEEGIIKRLTYNFIGRVLLGYDFYGNILCVKKGEKIK